MRRGAVFGGRRHWGFGAEGRRTADTRSPGEWSEAAGCGGGWRAAPTRALRAARATAPSQAAGEPGRPSVPEPRPPGERGGLAAGGGRGREKVAPLVRNPGAWSSSRRDRKERGERLITRRADLGAKAADLGRRPGAGRARGMRPADGGGG